MNSKIFRGRNTCLAALLACANLSLVSAAFAEDNWQPMPSSGGDQYNSSSLPAPTSPTVSNGYSGVQNTMPPVQNNMPPYQGRVAYIPAGMMIPVRLATSISSQVARAGDMVMAKTTEPITLANGTIPAETTLIGQVTNANSGARLGRSGSIGIKFTSIRMPNGMETPISAHIEGKVGKYDDKGGDTFRGENGMTKVKSSLLATAIGAGAGSALGVAVGSIAAGGRGLGRGAWSGAAIGSGAGLAESLLVRRGHDVNLTQGEMVNLQLDAPVTTAMN